MNDNQGMLLTFVPIIIKTIQLNLTVAVSTTNRMTSYIHYTL